MKLHEKIYQLRKQAGMSQEEAAEHLNISRQALSRWENGTAQPAANNIVEICKLFGVTSDYLLNDEYKSDLDVPAVKSVFQKAHYNVCRILGLGTAAIGFLGNLMIYIISRCVKVNAPLRTYDEATGSYWYHYDNVSRIDYGYFVREYRLEMIVAVLWILVLVGIGFLLWSMPSIRNWFRSHGKKKTESETQTDHNKPDRENSERHG